MIKLNYKNIQAASATHLDSVQQEILNQHAFQDKVTMAVARWKSKVSAVSGRNAFGDIKNTLIQMCVSVEICVYCEQNEATDIEHVFPKKLYPEKTFSWDNYVLACSKCNTHHKSDKFKIFNPQNSINEEDITPGRGIFREPPNSDGLFINPRIEDPMDLLELDLVNRQFIFTERYSPGTRGYQKARYTIDLLGLNTRAALIVSRKNAAIFYISRLEKYVNAKRSNNIQDLVEAINDDLGVINVNQNFEIEKQRILESIKEDILTYNHPTVWKELIRQRANLPKTNELLNQANEALSW